MSISTDYSYKSTISTVKVGNNTSFVAQAFTQDNAQIVRLEPDTSKDNSIKVYVSDAEAKVIASKAKKAGLSLNEYMRYAALGFPMS